MYVRLDVKFNRTSGMPKSFLNYELDKDSTLNWKLPINLVHYSMAAALLVSIYTEKVPDKFSGKERQQHDIFI